MSHLRSQIRSSVATRLSGLQTTGNKVWQSRMHPRDDASLPCLLITTNGEEIEQSIIGGFYSRQLDLLVIGLAKSTASIDAVLDQIALEVETAMAGEFRASLQRIETDFEDELDKPVGRIVLTYQFVYQTRAGSPGVSA